VLLRVLSLLVLSVFVDSDSEACEFIGDLEPSVVFMRHKRSFSEAMKVVNFFSNKGSGWVCASACATATAGVASLGFLITLPIG
jgi:hypothetical protein